MKSKMVVNQKLKNMKLDENKSNLSENSTMCHDIEKRHFNYSHKTSKLDKLVLPVNDQIQDTCRTTAFH